VRGPGDDALDSFGQEEAEGNLELADRHARAVGRDAEGFGEGVRHEARHGPPRRRCVPAGNEGLGRKAESLFSVARQEDERGAVRRPAVAAAVGDRARGDGLERDGRAVVAGDGQGGGRGVVVLSRVLSTAEGRAGGPVGELALRAGGPNPPAAEADAVRDGQPVDGVPLGHTPSLSGSSLRLRVVPRHVGELAALLVRAEHVDPALVAVLPRVGGGRVGLAER